MNYSQDYIAMDFTQSSLRRTNNIAENFNRKLNSLVNTHRPRITLLVSVLKEITIEEKKKIIEQ